MKTIVGSSDVRYKYKILVHFPGRTHLRLNSRLWRTLDSGFRSM